MKLLLKFTAHRNASLAITKKNLNYQALTLKMCLLLLFPYVQYVVNCFLRLRASIDYKTLIVL